MSEDFEKMTIIKLIGGQFYIRGFSHKFDSEESAEAFKSKYESAPAVTLETRFPVAPNITFEFRKIEDAYYNLGHQMMYELDGGMFVYSTPEESKSDAQQSYDDNPNQFFILHRSST